MTRLAAIVLPACFFSCGTSTGSPAATLQSAATGPVLTRASGTTSLGSQLSGRQKDGSLPVYGGNECVELVLTLAGEELCAASGGLQQPRTNFIYVTLTMIGPGGKGTLTAGTFHMNDNIDGGVFVTTSDADNCVDNGDYLKYDQGTVTITNLGSASTPTTGSIDLLLRNGAGSLKGDFSAIPCLATNDESTQSTSCR